MLFRSHPFNSFIRKAIFGNLHKKAIFTGFKSRKRVRNIVRVIMGNNLEKYKSVKL